VGAAGVQHERAREAGYDAIEQPHDVAARAQAAVVGADVQPGAVPGQAAVRLGQPHEQAARARAEEQHGPPPGPRQHLGGEEQGCHAPAAGEQHGRAGVREREAAAQRAEHVHRGAGLEPRQRPRAGAHRGVEELVAQRAAAARHGGDAHRAREQHRLGRGQPELDELTRRGGGKGQRDLQLEPVMPGPDGLVPDDARGALPPHGPGRVQRMRSRSVSRGAGTALREVSTTAVSRPAARRAVSGGAVYGLSPARPGAGVVPA